MQCELLFKKNKVSLVIIVVCIILFPIYNIVFFNIYTASDVANCPYCVGDNFCSCFINGSFSFDLNHFWSNLFNVGLKKLKGEKSIVFGMCNNRQVVLKKLSTNLHVENKFHPAVDFAINSSNEIFNVFKHFAYHTNAHLFGKFNFCPDTNRLVTLFKPIIANSYNITNLYFNLKFMFEVNMEPMIQQVTKDWAIAPYLGGCGTITVSEYCGESLTWIAPHLNWSERAFVATQLLQFAYNATFDNPAFAFYFTDMSADNFAVSSNKVVRLVDLEYVIVLDKVAKDVPDDWTKIHQVYHDDKSNEFTFSKLDICSHHISDFNIYAICQGILSEQADLIVGGLLHSPPKHLQHIRHLIRDCVSPREKASRFDAAYSILKALDVR